MARFTIRRLATGSSGLPPRNISNMILDGCTYNALPSFPGSSYQILLHLVVKLQSFKTYFSTLCSDLSRHFLCDSPTNGYRSLVAVLPMDIPMLYGNNHSIFISRSSLEATENNSVNLLIRRHSRTPFFAAFMCLSSVATYFRKYRISAKLAYISPVPRMCQSSSEA